MEECKYYSKCAFGGSCSKAPLDDVVFENVNWQRTPACFMVKRRQRPKRKSNVPKFRRYEAD